MGLPLRQLFFLLVVGLPAVGYGQGVPKKSLGEVALSVVRRFVPPGSVIAQDYSYDFSAGRVSRRWPVVLTGHFMSSTSDDIVFAYYTYRGLRYIDKTLFVGLLHLTGRGWELAYTLSYRDRYLWSPHAVLVVKLHGLPTDALVVGTAMGAALGSSVEVLSWRSDRGWRNLLPPNGGVGYFYVFNRPDGVHVALTSANHPGLNVLPHPVWLRWDGKEFMRIGTPKGDSAWKPLD